MPKARTIAFLVAAATSLVDHTDSALAQAPPCRSREYADNAYTVCEVDLAKHTVRPYLTRCLECAAVACLAACCHSGGCSDQPGQLDEIVGSHCQRELEVELLNTTQHWPRQSADGLAPP